MPSYLVSDRPTLWSVASRYHTTWVHSIHLHSSYFVTIENAFSSFNDETNGVVVGWRFIQYVLRSPCLKANPWNFCNCVWLLPFFLGFPPGVISSSSSEYDNVAPLFWPLHFSRTWSYKLIALYDPVLWFDPCFEQSIPCDRLPENWLW